MKRIFIYGLAMLSGLLVSAQGWSYSTEFGTDFQSSYDIHGVEYVNCTTGRRSVQSAGVCMRQDLMNNGSDIEAYTYTTDIRRTLSGLEGKVARGVASQRPRRSSYTSNNSRAKTSGKKNRRAGSSYNHQVSEAHMDWLRQKRERELQAREAAAEKKRQEELARKIADDNRAAAVESQTNAMLQAHTDRRIQSDYYNANEGAYKALQMARRAQRRVGPQFEATRQITSAEYKAGVLRRQNKPRRIMYPSTQPGNSARPQLAQVQRKSADSIRSAQLRRALMVREELRRRKESSRQRSDASKGIKLTDNSVSTLGKDWNSDDFKPVEIPPRTKKYTLTPEEHHILMCKEMYEVKLTPYEEYRYQQISKKFDES
ncbi:MAG: hypothetical protein K2L33_03280 [Muribaculaceae bacterium]|nr:hypothetical protein [Muribaculaceae bacterium]